MRTHRWKWMLWAAAGAAVLCGQQTGAATLAAWAFGGGGGASGGGGILAGSTLGEGGVAGPSGGGTSQITAGFQAAWLATLGPSDAGPDTDHDGIPDSIDPDDDNDGLSDDEERGLGTNPLLVDTDGDGFDDYVEDRVTHTGPNDRDSFLRCVDIRRAGAAVRVDWASETAVTNYFVDRALMLDDPAPWIPWMGPLSGAGAVTSVVDPASPTGAAYRVRIPY